MHFGLILIYCRTVGSLLQIRDVPDEVRRALKSRAAARGESLNGYLLAVIANEVARPTVREVLDRAARRAEQSAGSAVEALEAARAERDEQLQSRADA